LLLDEVSTLNGTSGGESPAGSALSLVLNWGDGTLGSPVNGISEVGGVESDWLLGLEANWGLVSEEFAGLILGPGGEVVVSNGERGVLGIHFLDLSILLGEDVHSEDELLLGSVGESVHVHVLHERLLKTVVVVLVAYVLDTSESGSFAE